MRGGAGPADAGGRLLAGAAILAFAAIVAVLTWNAAHDLAPDRRNVGDFADFRDAVYYPVRAVLDGNNPYDIPAHRAAYPVGQEFPVYGPHHLLLWLPLAWLPIGVARVVYAALMLVLLLVVARMAVTAARLRATIPLVVGIASVVLVSTPGRFNFFTGQSTLLIVVGCYLAAWYADDRPALAGVGLALAAVKPVYAVPVVVLLLARGRLRAVAWGAGITAVASLPIVVALAWSAGGVGSLVTVIGDNMSDTAANPSLDPVGSETRIDLHSLAAKAFGALDSPAAAVPVLVLALAVTIVVVKRDEIRDRPLVQGALALAVLVSLVHQQYDLLLLVAPVAALVVVVARRADRYAAAVAALCLAAAFNPLATDTVTSSLDEDHRPLGIATTAVLLAVAFAVALAGVARERRLSAAPVPAVTA